MKNKILTLLIAAMITSAAVMSACSARNNASLDDGSASGSTASSVPDEAAQVVSEAESSGDDTASQSEEGEGPKTVRIDADGGLRMRGGPGTDYDIIKLIPDKSYAEVAEGKEDNPEWLYVSYDGDSGWVSKEYISYEADSEAENGSELWAKVYYDYLSSFGEMTYTSAMYGGSYTVAGRTTGGEKIPCSTVEFRSMEGYAYPVLVCWDGEPLDAEGSMDGPSFVPNIYLVENESIRRIEQADSEWQALMLAGDFLEPKGGILASFTFKPENGGGPEEIEKALEWLKTQK